MQPSQRPVSYPVSHWHLLPGPTPAEEPSTIGVSNHSFSQASTLRLPTLRAHPDSISRLQEYHEPSDNSFRETLRNIDDTFYKTFPAAARAASQASGDSSYYWPVYNDVKFDAEYPTGSSCDQVPADVDAIAVLEQGTRSQPPSGTTITSGLRMDTNHVPSGGQMGEDQYTSPAYSFVQTPTPYGPILPVSPSLSLALPVHQGPHSPDARILVVRSIPAKTFLSCGPGLSSRINPPSNSNHQLFRR